MRNSKVYILTICAMAIAINIVLGTIVQRLSIPLLHLDTIGTILVAVLFGPWYGAAVGTATNVLSPILSGNPRDIPFFIVNALVGLIVGYAARKYSFKLRPALITGIIIGIVAPIVGSFIAVWVYGGITGGGNDVIFMFLQKFGARVFTAAFLPRLGGNLIDKIGSCILISSIVYMLPKQYKAYNTKL